MARQAGGPLSPLPEGLPRDVDPGPLVDDLVQMHEQGEEAAAVVSLPLAAADIFGGARDDGDGFQRHAGELPEGLLIGIALPEQLAQFAVAAAVDGDVEVARGVDHRVRVAAHHARHGQHLADGLPEERRLRVAQRNPLDVRQADGQRDAHRVGVLQRHRALDAHHVRRQVDVVVGGCQQRLDPRERLHGLAAQRHRGVLACAQLRADARAADGVDAQAAAGGHLPRVGLRDGQQLAVRLHLKPLRQRKHLQGIGDGGEDGLREPVDAEGGHAADEQVASLQRGGQLLDLVAAHARRQRQLQLRMVAVRLDALDDRAVVRRAHQTDFVMVVRRGKAHGRPHHAGPDDCDSCHGIASLDDVL